MMTGRPKERAAASFGAEPPLFFVTTTSIACDRSNDTSPSSVNGPRSRISCIRGGAGPDGGSTVRTRNHDEQEAKHPRVCRPVVRNTRSNGATADAAAANDGTRIQSSPGTGDQAGRRSTSNGTSAWRQAEAACALIVAANGWVASTTVSIRASVRKRTSPAAPPKPPIRTAPGNGTGSRTRPARDEITKNPE